MVGSKELISLLFVELKKDGHYSKIFYYLNCLVIYYSIRPLLNMQDLQQNLKLLYEIISKF